MFSSLSITLFLYFLTAIAKGREEKFTFGDCDMSIGPPDFLKYFKKAYHVPMFFEFFLSLLGISVVFNNYWLLLLFPIWAWIEDIFYWVKNPFDTITDKSWITGGFGGFYLGKQFIPYIYCGFFVYTLITILFFILK